MKSHKLIGLLKTFSRKEMTHFRAFIHSPYFNKHKGIKRLVDYLDLIFPKYDDRNCSRALLTKKLFGATPKDKNQLHLLFTYTFRLVEQFLAQEQFQQQTSPQDIMLLKSLRSREQFRRYDKVLKGAEAQLQYQIIQDSGYYNSQYLLATEADEYYRQIKRRHKDHHIQQKQNYLDKFYLSEKLKDACEMKVRSNILKVDYAPKLLETVLQEVEDNAAHYAKEPAIYVYYQIYQMITQDKQDYYFEALATLEGNQERFSKHELKLIYNYFQNYCIEQINKGSNQFLAEIFKLYQSQLDQLLILEDGLLSEWHYKNIVTTGLRLKEMDWVRQFIETYKNKLQAESVENAYIYNMASWYHAKQEFDKVLNLLVKVEYVDLRYSLGAKALLLRTYFELEEFESLFYLTDSFKQYLHRNKLMADSRRQGYYNLFRFTKRIAQIKSSFGFSNQEKLRREYQKLSADTMDAAIFNKAWLEEKLAAIGKLLNEHK